MTVFWKQCLQQSFHPKIVYPSGKAFVNFSFCDAIGPTCVGMMAGWHFNRLLPFTDTLTNMSVAALCNDYEKATGQHWNESIGIHSKFSLAVDILKRAKNVDDKQTIVDAIKSTKLDTIQGVCDFTLPVDPKGKHIHPNAVRSVWITNQVIKGADANPPSKWPYEVNIVAADTGVTGERFAELDAVMAKPTLMSYS